MRARSALALVALLVLAGCTAPTADPPTTGTQPTAVGDGGSPPEDGAGPAGDGTGSGPADGQASGPDGSPVASGVPPDPPADRLGWEGGVWYNESIAVNQTDGLTDAELNATVSRAMARVERLRGLEFEADVPVEVVDRATYRNETTWVRDDPSYAAWTNQVWEALFVVDEGTDATAELKKLYGSNVQGFYVPSADRLVVVSGGDGPPSVDNATLVHELTHALQDQHFDLTAPRYAGATRDAELAGNGLTEGEASYVERLYGERCRGEWACVRSAGGSGSVGADQRVNLGMLMTVLQPYSDGPAYVHRLVESGGWEAVAAAHRDPPASTEQVIHPGRDDPPTDVTVADRARDGWTRFEFGDGGAQTVGEASIYTALWYQTTHYRIEVGRVGAIFEASGPYDSYNYSGRPSAGWDGDALVPYQRDGEFGYVWATAWDSPADAREFHEAYLTVLRGHGAERAGRYTWVIRDGGYADAFHVRRDGSRVTVVDAPTVADLRDLRPGLETGPAPTANGSVTGGT